MIKLIGDDLWQWDTGRQVEVLMDVNEVHFGCCVNKDALIVPVVDGVANIPNILLQSGLDVYVWYVSCSDDCSNTKCEFIFDVNRRNKPSDYAYTETEVRNYDAMKKLVLDLQEKVDHNTAEIDRAVSEYLKENPPNTIEIDDELSEESTNPVQNRVVTLSLKEMETTVGNIDVLLGTI